MKTLAQALEVVFENFTVKQTERLNKVYAEVVEKNITTKKEVWDYTRVFKSARLFYNSVVGGYAIMNQEEATTIIKKVVDSNVAEFRGRIGVKLDWVKSLENAEVIDYMVSNIYDYLIQIKIGDITFNINGDVVVNYSPLGNEFLQYPITFRQGRVGDKKIPAGELNLKKAISEKLSVTIEGAK